MRLHVVAWGVAASLLIAAPAKLAGAFRPRRGAAPLETLIPAGGASLYARIVALTWGPRYTAGQGRASPSAAPASGRCSR